MLIKWFAAKEIVSKVAVFLHEKIKLKIQETFYVEINQSINKKSVE